MPVAVYAHGSGDSIGCAVTGGYVYRGPVAGLRGNYFFGDYCSGRIWRLVAKPGNQTGVQVADTGLSITSFGVDDAGNEYVVSLSGNDLQDRAVTGPRLQSGAMLELVLYARPGCHLCAEARTTIDAILADRRRNGLSLPAVVERDISTNDAWERAFFAEIPVVEIGDRRLTLATSPGRLRRFLDEALGAAVAG